MSYLCYPRPVLRKKCKETGERMQDTQDGEACWKKKEMSCRHIMTIVLTNSPWFWLPAARPNLHKIELIKISSGKGEEPMRAPTLLRDS